MRGMIRLVGMAAVFGSELLAGAVHSACGDGGQAPVRDPEHRVNVRVSNWRDLQRLDIVMQKRDYSCGAAALATVLRYFWGDPVGEEKVLVALGEVLTAEEIKDRLKKGMAISDLRRAAVKMGYASSIGTMSFQDLCGSRVPLIVPIRLEEYDHFVVYRGVVGNRVYLADPIRGNVRPTITEFCRQWQKNAILAVAKPGVRLPESSPLGIHPEEVLLGETTDQFLRRELPGRLIPPAPEVIR
jgi:uncharacterized protein